MIDQIVHGINDFARYIIPLLLVGIPFYGLVFKKINAPPSMGYEMYDDGNGNDYALDDFFD